jgi:hypothetical protein
MVSYRLIVSELPATEHNLHDGVDVITGLQNTDRRPSPEMGPITFALSQSRQEFVGDIGGPKRGKTSTSAPLPGWVTLFDNLRHHGSIGLHFAIHF